MSSSTLDPLPIVGAPEMFGERANTCVLYDCSVAMALSCGFLHIKE